MNRTLVIIVGYACIASMFAYHANGQGVKQYLNDSSLSAARVEIELPADALPKQSFWDKILSYLGTRSAIKIHPKEGTVLRVVSSAYASSPYQTDATPCITAAGTTVRPGVVATNFLPLGTVVSIDDKKYIVEDRMNSRYNGYYLDIWFPSTSEALEFGRKKLDITIVSYETPGAEINPTPTPSPQVAPEENTTLWQSVSSSVSVIREFLFTRTYSDPNKYDVDCSN